jgi:hypothetical protein
MIICALNQNMLALHFSKILATDDDNKGLNCFHPAFHGKHALEPVINFEERHVLPESSKPAQNALSARSDAVWIHGLPLNSSHLAKAAMIPLGLRAQS